jgi:hypothetical protein
VTDPEQRLEQEVGQALCSYLAAPARPIWEDNPPVRELCSRLEWLLDVLLRADARWNPDHWIDGVLPSSVTTVGQRGIEVLGVAIWSDREASGMWVEPFSATLALCSSGSLLESYSIRFADSTIGLGTSPHDAPTLSGRPSPDNWIFQFTRASLPPAMD